MKSTRGCAWERDRQNEDRCSLERLTQLKRRRHPDVPPPLVSDGWGGQPLIADVDAPSLKQPSEDWQYVLLAKQRDNGRVIGVELRVIFAHPLSTS
ncbi:MAG: hypothetical protein ACUVSU_16840 [Aggregatilineaceae bacterium]